MRTPTVRIADSLPPEPGMSQEYFNAKYKAWLRRRGFDQEADDMEQRTFLNRRRRASQLGKPAREGQP